LPSYVVIFAKLRSGGLQLIDKKSLDKGQFLPSYVVIFAKLRSGGFT